MYTKYQSKGLGAQAQRAPRYSQRSVVEQPLAPLCFQPPTTNTVSAPRPPQRFWLSPATSSVVRSLRVTPR